MFRPLPYILSCVILCLPACASKDTAGHTPAHTSVKSPTLITIAKNGAIHVNRERVPLKKLAVTLKGMGLDKNSKFRIEGEPGSDQKDIDQVLEILADNGLLPKNTID
jgi:biopolymer transport protein ExbD